MKVLLVDDEPNILEIVELMFTEAAQVDCEFIKAQNAKEAIGILSNASFDLVISDHDMPGGSGDLLFGYFKESNNRTPYVLCSSHNPRNFGNLYSGIYFSIEKPSIGLGVSDLIDKLNYDKLIIKGNEAPKAGYTKVSIDLLLAVRTFPSDLYVQISATKFVKCIRAKEAFTLVDYYKWKNKNVTYLYTRQGLGREVLTTGFTEQLTLLMQKNEISILDKIQDSHKRMMKALKFLNLKKETIKNSKTCILKTIDLINQTNQIEDHWKNVMLLSEYSADLYVLQSIISTHLATQVGWSADIVYNNLAMGVFLQDISLFIDDFIWVLDQENFHEVIQEKHTLDEIKNYLEHPYNALSIVHQLEAIPLDVEKIILEQHEEPRGTGFPKALNSKQISPLSCLFIISSLIAKKILLEKTEFSVGKLKAWLKSKGYNEGNFSDIYQVLDALN